jgi:hypothetical protein
VKLCRPPLIPKPYVIPDSYLYSSDFGESEHSAYSSTGAYAVGDRVQVVSPSTTVTISQAAPCVVTWANHGLADNTPITFTTSGALPGGLEVGAVYYVKSGKQNTFNLAAALPGPALATSSAGSGTHTATATRHDVFEALLQTASVTGSIATTTLTVTAFTLGSELAVGHILSGTSVTAGTYIVKQLTSTESNGDLGMKGTYQVSVSSSAGSTAITGNAPVTNATYWGRAGSTNKWNMFDASSSSQSSKADSGTVELRPIGRYNELYLGNVSFASLQLQVRDEDDVLQHDETIDGAALNWDSGFYGWHFDPPERKTDFLIELPNILNPRITLIFTDPASTVFVGSCFPTQSREICATHYGMRLGIRDYSQKEVDSYGNSIFEEGAYSKTVSLTGMVDADDAPAVFNVLATCRGAAVVYSGANDSGSSVVFGKFNDYHLEVAYPTKTLFSCELESLT